MLQPQYGLAACTACRRQLLKVFIFDFCGLLMPRRLLLRCSNASRQQPARPRPVLSMTTVRHITSQSSNDRDLHILEAPIARSPAKMEGIARRARQTFGEYLPADFLTSEEYSIYERLYGSPLRATRPEEFGFLQGSHHRRLEQENEHQHRSQNILFRSKDDGELEEVDYEQQQPILRSEGPSDGLIGSGIISDVADDQADFVARLKLFQDMAAATKSFTSGEELENEIVAEEVEGPNEFDSQVSVNEHKYDLPEDLDRVESLYNSNDIVRSHPLTVAGRFGTNPSTLTLPKATFLDPITSALADLSNKHLTEAALKTFGGPGLPNSVATPALQPHLQQQPIALEASQSRMTDMEANVYLAAIMPGAYATITSILVEVRKRLGSDWLSGLLRSARGPRVLDAGGGGAGVLAWREVLRAEWERMHPRGSPEDKPVPLGKATAVTGSAALRFRSSKLLENTTFLPRLPDYISARDNTTHQNQKIPPRKTYDIIIAPHTLWPLKEDYMRRSHVHNLWSLLDPDGGVLLIIEKGVPRGFELVAGARELLLAKHILSPECRQSQIATEDASKGDLIKKEEGMIISPCTNHTQCPLYLSSGRNQGRKDFCHFSQRYIRPQFLQRVLGARNHNHEDVRFSYIAVQRGCDKRQDDNVMQGEAATETAFAGYETRSQVGDESAENAAEQLQDSSKIDALSFPRALMPPLKRKGHVTLDLCTPAGKIERWTVPKSFSKQAYRDARKLRWGDLWALGAKTRTLRNIKPGTSKVEGKVKKKIAFKDEDELDDTEDVDFDSGFKPLVLKADRMNKSGKMRSKRGRITRVG